MMLDARTRLTQKKIARTTANSLKTCNSLMSNPEVQAFYEKLEALTDHFPEFMWNPLNLVQWNKVKYHPTESENRIRIQNRISLKKASHEKVRPKVKPVKRKSQSVELFRQDQETNYQEHFKQIVKSSHSKKNHSQQIQSEEEPTEIFQPSQSQNGVRFFHKLQKYKHFASYIQERVGAKRSQEKEKRVTFYSQTNINRMSFTNSPAKRFSATSKTTFGKSFEEDLKIDSIVKKWKPASKIEKKFESNQASHCRRKRLSAKDIGRPIQLLIQTPRYRAIDDETPISSIQKPSAKIMNDNLIQC